ncbi:MAG: response regulator, partial [Acetobacter orientalis]|uniref:ANTAR domain-containing response regulator n=1 Tax=Acetobacter orientalis TaxID=146474 RepID=UPI0039EA7ADE
MKVLLADENSQRAGALARLLEADGTLDIILLDTQTSLIEAVRCHAPDIVLVDISRADRDALDSVRALSASPLERPVALFVDEDDETLMEEAFAAGICSYNVLDTQVKNVKTLLRSAIALYHRFRKNNAEHLPEKKT